jgi:23S rRNA (adenine2503-C2)-methyltransferase
MNNELIKEKVPLTGMTKLELEQMCTDHYEPEFRGRQLFHWIYAKRKREIREMANVPKKLRDELTRKFKIPSLDLVKSETSPSRKTRKFLFKIPTGGKIESVLMEDGERITVCLSTQVGCALGCTFCATAKMGFQKNLSVGEIIDQFLILQSSSKKRITNVVFMGMGEPFLNYERVLSSAELLNHPDGINLGKGKITISTAGIVPKIIRYADEGWKFKLAISLNGTLDKNRSEIMPINKKHNLSDLISASLYYYKKSKSLITFEYVLIENETDSIKDAQRLKSLLTDVPCKVNVIPYNSIDDSYNRPDQNRITQFLRELNSASFTVTVRWSHGTGINAGCGQLAVTKGAEI